ncbi:MAG: TIGR03619 family F420-dependent LLM class oxidoreductase, partial [Pseudomonadales bacterium]|nr:TIGR03619 family F420-dependent LLM class oxidoreductase [Pseudomonadales bacterium]
MKLGVVLPHNEIGNDAGAIRAYAQGIEALGAQHLLVYDHVLGADANRPGGWRGMYDSQVAFHEPLTFLSFVAGVTQSIELVTTVMILPQRQTALVAKQAAELQILSDNRFRLGVGTGWNKIEYEALGVPFENRGNRQAEQVELLRKLWQEDVFSFDGDFHTVNAAGINPRPSQDIP